MRAVLAAFAALAALAGCLGMMGPEAPDTPEVDPWSEGQALFERDPTWKGGDGAQTIPLGEERVLWLFGDTTVDPEGGGSERIVHNTVAIQTGLDPSNASFEAYWRNETVGSEDDGLPNPVAEDESRERPTAFFPNESEEVWYWPGGPAVVDGELIVFASRVRQAGQGAFGFEGAGWRVFEVEGVEQPPSEWSLDKVDPAIEDHNYTVGLAALVHEGYLYAYGERGVERDGFTVHEVAVVRWSLEDVRQDRWDRAEWWTGEEWSAQGDRPAVLFSGTAASFSVHAVNGRILVTGVEGFPTGEVTVRAGEAPQGPFSEPATVIDPAEDPEANHTQYAGRLHPELAGGDWIVTWHDSRFLRPQMAKATP